MEFPPVGSQVKGGVEQNRVLRDGTGLRVLDGTRAAPGCTLFAPPGNDVYLIDLQGEIVHTWRMPYPPGRYGYLTDRGTLFYNGRVPDDSWLGRQPFRGGAALEMDWDGHVLWEVRHPHHHHDGIRLRNGNVLLLAARAIPEALAARVRGGLRGPDGDGRIYASYLVELTIEGQVVWEWRSWEHFDPVEAVIPTVNDERDRWGVANGIAEWPNGDLVVSFPWMSTVITIDRQSGEIIWKLGAPPLSFQHAPTPLANGHLLIFDNGPHRLDDSLPYSRVIEIDPATKGIVWKYQDSPVSNFFSPRQGNAQRLPNGNTFICEALFGRFFEVTTTGELIWEYVNPFFGKMSEWSRYGGIQNGPRQALTNSVFRVYRYGEAEIEHARHAT